MSSDTSDHPYQCPCANCLGGSPGLCKETRSESICRCGFRKLVTRKWNEHRGMRRQVECRCGEILCEKRGRDHVKGCRLGRKKYVCLRPRAGDNVETHRLEFTNQGDFLTHFNDECKGKGAGRPRKETKRPK
ncbi:hypothetical protein LX32DRAFT_674705 [Colletotrichum zoysiae]|uniref:Uncharacterized protein n=1 Tax=Colletotrichum zoysiae TaxID=1216348 RepID=A0AAD9HDX2_9PEZI|nr:hypothetical protein LX32DRAFT_674705 [Colletotrichum zoysiae]